MKLMNAAKGYASRERSVVSEKKMSSGWPIWIVSVVIIVLLSGTAAYNRLNGFEYGFLKRQQVVSVAEVEHQARDRTEWREEQSLIAQRKTALWTFWVMIISGAGTLVAGFGLLFLRGTLNAALTANAHALESTQVSREIGMAQIQAYLTFEDADLVFDDDALVKFIIDNCGQSPATGVVAKRVSCEIFLHSPYGKPPRHFQSAYDQPMTVYLGNCKADGRKSVHIPLRFSPEQMSGIVECLRTGMSGTICGAGLFQWNDVFGRSHTQPFRFDEFIKTGVFKYSTEIQCDHVNEHYVISSWKNVLQTQPASLST